MRMREPASAAVATLPIDSAVERGLARLLLRLARRDLRTSRLALAEVSHRRTAPAAAEPESRSTDDDSDTDDMHDAAASSDDEDADDGGRQRHAEGEPLHVRGSAHARTTSLASLAVEVFLVRLEDRLAASADAVSHSQQRWLGSALAGIVSHLPDSDWQLRRLASRLNRIAATLARQEPLPTVTPSTAPERHSSVATGWAACALALADRAACAAVRSGTESSDAGSGTLSVPMIARDCVEALLSLATTPTGGMGESSLELAALAATLAAELGSMTSTAANDALAAWVGRAVRGRWLTRICRSLSSLPSAAAPSNDDKASAAEHASGDYESGSPQVLDRWAALAGLVADWPSLMSPIMTPDDTDWHAVCVRVGVDDAGVVQACSRIIADTLVSNDTCRAAQHLIARLACGLGSAAGFAGLAHAVRSTSELALGDATDLSTGRWDLGVWIAFVLAVPAGRTADDHDDDDKQAVTLRELALRRLQQLLDAAREAIEEQVLRRVHAWIAQQSESDSKSTSSSFDLEAVASLSRVSGRPLLAAAQCVRSCRRVLASKTSRDGVPSSLPEAAMDLLRDQSVRIKATRRAVLETAMQLRGLTESLRATAPASEAAHSDDDDDDDDSENEDAAEPAADSTRPSRQAHPSLVAEQLGLGLAAVSQALGDLVSEATALTID